MPEAVKGTKPNGVYKVNQKTGELEYKGQYPGAGQKAIQNAVRTVGARQAAGRRRAGL